MPEKSEMSSSKARRYRVGDVVKYPFWPDPVEAVIVEDLGPLGGEGRHVYRITISLPPAEPMTFDAPEDFFVNDE
jgi:hypothetical protein